MSDTTRGTPGARLDFDEFYAATWPRLLRTAYVVAGPASRRERAVAEPYAAELSGDGVGWVRGSR